MPAPAEPRRSLQKAFLEAAVALDGKLFHKEAGAPGRFARTFTPFFHALGGVLALLFVRWPPASLASFFNRSLALAKAGGVPGRLEEFLPGGREKTRALLESCRRKTDAAPAVLILTSHPETVGGEAPLIGRLVYHAISLAKSLSPQSPFKLVQAIDPFALDMLPHPVAALYAGFMAWGHLAVDRMPWKRKGMERSYLATFAAERSIFRILRELKAGTVLCQALGGGVIHNARLFYVLKEFARRLFRAGRARGERTELELKLLSLLSEGAEGACATGRLAIREEKEILRLAEELKVPQAEAAILVRDLTEELARDVPYRRRLFRILFRRLTAKRPLLIVPLSHTAAGDVRLGPARLVMRYEPATDAVHLIEAEDPNLVREVKLFKFAKGLFSASDGGGS